MAKSAAIPLEKMPLASVDLETTGLKPAQDRICQIGLVNPSDTTYTLDLLVDPGIPIPPASTAIHGIDDSMVAGADSFPLALPELRRMVNGRVILGYNIGFDLAVCSPSIFSTNRRYQAILAGNLGIRRLQEAMIDLGLLSETEKQETAAATNCRYLRGHPARNDDRSRLAF